MSFDTTARNRLAKLVGDLRGLLTTEFIGQCQSLFGIEASGKLADLQQLGHLDEAQLATAILLRERIDYLARTHPENKDAAESAVTQLVREQAFTVLNRFAALRMAERRGLVAESVEKVYQSKGFKVFETVARTGLRDAYDRYRQYIFCLSDELALDLGVLFDRRSPQGLLFPREASLLSCLDLLNAPDVEALWAEDETIGWIYQYYNDPAERREMRESAAPRNSRELAVRNQFFTPRYVVEFLTDNTLGRIWYEQTRGITTLKEKCRYLVRRPNESFLKEREAVPQRPDQEHLSNEELLAQQDSIPYRQLKDPRTILVLDPACGSMHFGLYAFDLFETIYEEAWELEEALGADALSRPGGMKPLHVTYAEKSVFLKDVPRLIVQHNLHGIDIDPRCTQIAGLSLWLRAQKAWQQLGLRPSERPIIRWSNIVCAEPMPGDKGRLREFVEREFAVAEQHFFLRLLEGVFDQMQLAGEAGSLLKIEKEIRSAIADAKLLWKQAPKVEQSKLFAELEVARQASLAADLSGITDEQFWDNAESRIYAALRDYAAQAEDGVQPRLFAEDAARGFAFIDVCSKRYDVALMNPPFGDASSRAKAYVQLTFPESMRDLGICFVDRARELASCTGQIVSRTSWFLSSFEAWRRTIASNSTIAVAADLGFGVLDGAMVETVAFSCEDHQRRDESVVIRLVGTDGQDVRLLTVCRHIGDGVISSEVFIRDFGVLLKVPGACFAYWARPEHIRLFLHHQPLYPASAEIHWGLFSADDFRFLRLWSEVPATELNNKWIGYAKGGDYAEFYAPIYLVVNWRLHGQEIRENRDADGKARSRIPNSEWYFRPGLTYSSVTVKGLAVRTLPEGCIFSIKGPGIIPANVRVAYCLLGFLNSPLARTLMLYQTPSRSWDVSMLRRLPTVAGMPDEVGEIAETIVKNRIVLFARDELSRNCRIPRFAETKALEDVCRQDAGDLKNLNAEITQRKSTLDEIVEHHFVGRLGTNGLGEVAVAEDANANGEDDETAAAEPITVENILSWVFGMAFGRWDIRRASEGLPRQPLDPFAPLPVCPPAQLCNEEGDPIDREEVARLAETAWKYPVEIPWNGIFCDDPAHTWDLEARIQGVLQAVWKDQWESIYRELCTNLSVETLREHFRKPTAFFSHHLKCYSKSRRQAPIYWPLSTASGSYTLWVYYHRLTDQTLHLALADFVAPKIRDVERHLAEARTASRQKEVERIASLLAEMQAFRTDLEDVIRLPWKPNLNDGVLITASPLWRLFRLPKWQKDLKSCWQKLQAGEFDWANLALNIWPERVRAACQTDRSIAIAHGLEHLFHEPVIAKRRKRVGARQASESR